MFYINPYVYFPSLDFLSGITFALQGKITPISAKTYFVTPQNVDILGAQPEQPESDGQYF